MSGRGKKSLIQNASRNPRSCDYTKMTFMLVTLAICLELCLDLVFVWIETSLESFSVSTTAVQLFQSCGIAHITTCFSSIFTARVYIRSMVLPNRSLYHYDNALLRGGALFGCPHARSGVSFCNFC